MSTSNLKTLGLPFNPTIYRLPSLDEDQTLVWLLVVHFTCPMISSIPHYCTVSTFHRPSQFVLKTECFHYVSVENCMWKYGQEGFFRLTYVETKHQSNEHNQGGANDFQCLIWIFRVCWLSPAWYNVDCFQLMSRFEHYQLQLVYLTIIQREISSTKLCKPLFKKLINFWLHWFFIAVRRLSLFVSSRSYSSLRCMGFSLQWLLLFRSTGSRRASFSSCGTQAQ